MAPPPVRAFVAIELPSRLRQALWAGTAEARAAYPQGRWVAAGSLHITVKFLGDLDPARVPEVGECLDGVCERHRPYRVVLGGLGTFPGGSRARVIWAGITSGGEETGHLARDADAALSRLGFEPETRSFRAHLTIARVGQAVPTAALTGALERLRVVEWGGFEVGRLVLMQSILRPQGPLYRPISYHILGGVATSPGPCYTR